MLAPVAQQGAGLIQAYDAAYATTLLDTSNLDFSDVDHHAGILNFSISNTGKEEVTYELGSVGAATTYTFSRRMHNNGFAPAIAHFFPNVFPDDVTDVVPDFFPGIEFEDSYATVGLSESNVTLAPGARKFISVTATPPTLNATRLPVYSGYVTVNGTNGENLSLPYQGVAGSLHDTPVLGTGYLTKHNIDSDEKTVVHTMAKDNATFTISKGDDPSTPIQYFPEAAGFLTFGTPLVHIEAIKVSCDNATLLNSTKNLGDILDSPFRWLSRGAYALPWGGRLHNQNKSYAPEGKYRFAIRALHMFGNEKNESDYDVAYTKDFNIEYR